MSTSPTPDYIRQADDFVDNETQFHLGFLPTEQSSPLTRDLDRVFASDTAAGVRALQTVDRNVAAMAERVLAREAFARLVATGTAALREGRRLVFSGCGATGRLSILLEAMWRRHWWNNPGPTGLRYGNNVYSIMTGGDYALIRSVEFFEDYAAFGRQQVRELGLEAGDVLVAITEGGETSSVLGTVDEAVRRGAAVFLLFNNPADLLREHLDRCREAIDNPAVTVLDLSCGPMAIAGSTRMQATTAEQLVAGAALEEMHRQLLDPDSPARDWAAEFNGLLDRLAAAEAVATVADYLEFEADLYQRGGRITYYASDLLLDIFTDTTERSPTFMIPPFRKYDDAVSPPSWAFVKNPMLPTPVAWECCLGREPRCLDWTVAEYQRMGADDRIEASPPKLDREELMKFTIGNEDTPDRYRGVPNAAVLVGHGIGLEASFAGVAVPFAQRRHLAIPGDPGPSPLELMRRLAVKLTMNTISTGTMILLGRVAGNWMSWVDVSNKKLIDRATRLVAELCDMDYRPACRELFRAIADLQNLPADAERPSPVQVVLERLRKE